MPFKIECDECGWAGEIHTAECSQGTYVNQDDVVIYSAAITEENDVPRVWFSANPFDPHETPEKGFGFSLVDEGDLQTEDVARLERHHDIPPPMRKTVET